MKNISAKLRSTRGETLAEILVSIAILGLSITLMLTMVATSTEITKKTRDKDKDLMRELNAAEEQSETNRRLDKGDVKISGDGGDISIPVNIYADDTADNPLISYSID